jgi:predicted butyrate kinase (DUF1464 family)
MPRVVGIDPGTVSIDLCGLQDGRLFLDQSFPTGDALADPSTLVKLLEAHAPLDLVVGPSGYGLPLTAARDLTEIDYKLAYLAAAGESGGIGGLRSLMRALAASTLPVVLTPGVIHLQSVPAHRKVNRVDMGTADKVCAAALAIREHAARHGCGEREASFILLELGGAFTAVLAVRNGQIVDGIAGSAGPLGARAAGALDGEVAFLAGSISKRMVFEGGAASIAGQPDGDPTELFASKTAAAALAREAYVESALKAVAAASVSLTDAPSERAARPRQSSPEASDGGTVREVILSGRFAGVPAVRDELTRRLRGRATVHLLSGFAVTAKHAAQGAALVADGLADGSSAPMVDALGIRGARGTLLDHLYVISADAARARLGISK